MHTRLVPVEPINGFMINQPIEFNEYICLITGINGSGKTRLLKSISEGKTKVFIDGNETPQDEIKIIDVKDIDINILSPTGDIDKSTLLARNIIKIIEECQDIRYLPEIVHMPLEQAGRYAPYIDVKVREITERACRLFDTQFNALHQKQLELSIYAHNELLHGLSNDFFDSNRISLSQLTINYYQALECNFLLGYYKNKIQDIKQIQEESLLKIIKEKSPHLLFNEIIIDLFNGKFKINEPNIKHSTVEYYAPKLLDGNGSEIKLTDLSSGEQIIFWLVTKIFQTYYSTLGGNYTKARVILMDEPDAHLHPKMILDFYKCLEIINKSLGVIFIFNSHSPTTVALANFENIFQLSYSHDKKVIVEKIPKDGAISSLLEGITQITINPENRREVYVENVTDVYVYELIYTNIKNIAKLNKNIILSFTTPSSKIVESQLKQLIESVYGIDDDKVAQLIGKINGQANCDQVTGTVENLRGLGNKTATGLIDWDTKNKSNNNGVVVLGEGVCYSIENVIYDPISIFAYVERTWGKSYFCNCDENIQRSDVLSDDTLVQQIFDKVVFDILGRESNRDIAVKYLNGKSYLGDREYYTGNGHDLEVIILEFYKMKDLTCTNKKHKKLYHFFKESTKDLLECKYINTIFEDAFLGLQQS